MRLFNVHTLEFRDFYSDELPRYAVTSHRWVHGDEATLADVRDQRNMGTSGFRKMIGFARYIADNIEHLDWMWMDTVCINQDSSQEVSEAVNSMYRLYSGAEICLAYLADIANGGDTFRHSVWFTRGWTLQELIAPPCVVFLTQHWAVLGHKGRQRDHSGIGSFPVGKSLETTLAEVTRIPLAVLREPLKVEDQSVQDKLSWMENRRTTREEDQSYSLLGIFGVHLPLIYGEGRDNARRRLLQEVSDRAKAYREEAQTSDWEMVGTPTLYRGFSLRKSEPRFGEEESWARVICTPLPFSDKELAEESRRIKLQTKTDAVTVYANLSGEQSGIVNRIISELNDDEQAEYGPYILDSVKKLKEHKRISWRTGVTRTSQIQIIVKRRGLFGTTNELIQ